ncbi:glycerol-3-phosphate acyltransferase, partial [Campylobacter jejuni]|nr:glycerol-3-phosphate acyltransferase [Campylobacter jejuni]
IPFGLILAKFFAKTDIKKGSKSIGATNVLRVVKEKNPKLAKKLAIATIILDFAKAAIPLLILKFLHYDQALLW